MASNQDDLDPGTAVVSMLFERLQIDPTWSTSSDRGFEWWPYLVAQRVWAGEPEGTDERAVSHVHIECDAVRDVEDTPAVLEAISQINRLTTLSALRFDEGKVRLQASVAVNRGNVPFAGTLAMNAMALQLAEAYRVADALRGVGGEIDDSAHPSSGPRPTPDEMLGVGNLYLEPGQKAPEIDFIRLSNSKDTCWTMANGAPAGFMAELPLRPDAAPSLIQLTDRDTPAEQPAALFQAATNQAHPVFGPGVLTMLQLPHVVDNGPAVANYLNIADSVAPASHVLGAWSAGADSMLTYATFYPAIMFAGQDAEFGYRLFESLVWHAAAHAMRIEGILGPNLSNKPTLN